MKIKIFVLLSILLSIFLISGCSEGASQLHEKLIIKGIGIDYNDNKYIITLHLLQAMGTQEQAKTQVVGGDGDTIISAMENIINKTGKEPLYSHCEYLIIGDETAKNKTYEIINFLTDYNEIRPSVSLFVSKTSAKDIMTLKDSNKEISSEDFQKLKNIEAISGNTINSTVFDFINDLNNKYSSGVTALLNITGNKDNYEIVTEGCGVFRDYEYQGELTPDETVILLLLRDELQTGYIKIDISEEKCNFIVNESETLVDVNNNNNKLEYIFNISVLLQKIEQTSPNITDYDMLVKNVKEKLEDDIYKLLLKITNEYKTDSLYLGRRGIKNHSSVLENIDNWNEYLKEISFTVNINEINII